MNLQIFKLMKKYLTISNKNNSIYWDRSHCLFVNENLEINDIKEFINDYIYPKKEELIVIKIYCENGTHIDQISDLYPDAKLLDRIILKHDMEIVPKNTQNNDYYDLPKMNESIKKFENYDELYSEICSVWNSFNYFIDNGFGIVHVKDDKIISWCLSEYNGQGYCGMGIETIEEYQNQKIGTKSPSLTTDNFLIISSISNSLSGSISGCMGSINIPSAKNLDDGDIKLLIKKNGKQKRTVVGETEIR